MMRRLLAMVVPLLVLAGLAFQSTLPGLDLAMRGAEVPWMLPGGQASICHSSPDGKAQQAAIPGEDGQSSSSDGCCLICQAVQLAKGVLPSPTFKTPTRGTAALLAPLAGSAVAEGHASLYKLPRAPPVA